MNKEKKLLIFAIIVLAISLIYLLSQFYFTFEKKSYKASLIVSDKPGIDLNGSAITFGQIIPGTSASREIKINNPYKKEIIFEINSEGNISKFLDHEKKGGLETMETKKVGFNVVVPENASKGEYTGNIQILLKKKLF